MGTDRKLHSRIRANALHDTIMYRLPESQVERVTLATSIGADGVTLLEVHTTADAPDWLDTVPAIQPLRHVWIQNYTWTE